MILEVRTASIKFGNEDFQNYFLTLPDYLLKPTKQKLNWFKNDSNNLTLLLRSFINTVQ